MQRSSLMQRIIRRIARLTNAALWRWRELRFRLNRRQIHGPANLHAMPADVVLVCVVRNGNAYLDHFLQHYRELGVTHMVFLDNGSDDGTPERLCQEEDVTVLTTTLPFGKYKYVMRRYLASNYGPNNWVLVVDIDELFDYPFRNNFPLSNLVPYLNDNGFTAVTAQMLDMFPKDALRGDVGNWRSSHKFYDISTLEIGDYVQSYGAKNRISNPEIAHYFGGVRAKSFGTRSLLTKHPMIFPSKGAVIEFDHHIHNASIADFSAVLLHYKYVGDFMKYIRSAVVEGNMFRGSQEYRKYLEVLDRNPNVSLYGNNSIELNKIEQLVDCGFLVVSERYSVTANSL